METPAAWEALQDCVEELSFELGEPAEFRAVGRAFGEDGNSFSFLCALFVLSIWMDFHGGEGFGDWRLAGMTFMAPGN